MAADRRGVAAAAASAERAAGAGRRCSTAPARRRSRSRSPRSRSRPARSRGSFCALTGSRCGRRRRRRGVRAEPERAVPAGHADDRAAAAGADDAGGGDADRAGATRRPSVEPALPARPAPSIGWVFALACLTRYEAWPVTVAALAAAAWARWRQGDPLAGAVAPRRRDRRLSRSPRSPAFVVFSRVVIGEWFVAERVLRAGEQGARRSADRRPREIWWGLRSAERLRRSLAIGAAGPASRCWLSASTKAAGRAALIAAVALARPRRCRGSRSSTATRSGSATWCR